MSWSATAPSNIALIKYMGKADHQLSSLPDQYITGHLSKKDKWDFYFKNQSLNPSLSYTLSHFVTTVRIEESGEDNWSLFNENPFQNRRLYSFSRKIDFNNEVSASAQKRFLDFFQFLKRFFLIPGHYTIFSQNNFPTAIGAASSASSFSALTLAAYKLARDRSALKEKTNNMTIQDLAHLSRVGSGSSCRSFFSPWCIWTNQKILPFETSWKRLLHQLIVVDFQAKEASSTKAHKMVKTSPHFKNRSDRAKKRMESLSQALNRKNWKKCFQICYEEFLDLHSLFETAEPPLKYKNDSTQKVLDYVNDFWKNNKDGPLITMDAGANVHLLYRPNQQKQREKIESLLANFAVLSSL